MICTLTLNPAIDVHASVEELKIGKENHVRITSRCAGGKGINVSRALLAYGIESRAVTVIGSDGEDEFSRLVADSGLTPYYLKAGGRIRENLTVHADSGVETRISQSGSLSSRGVLDELAFAIQDAEYVILAGSLPRDIDKARLKSILAEKRDSGAKLVVDSRSIEYRELAELSPWLVKPNLEELSAYFGREISTRDEAISCAELMYALGIENVMVSLGKDGAVLVCKEGIFTESAPKINAISTIGAGDSSIAGFVTAASLGLTKREALRYAVAFGSAACLENGTEPPTRVNIDKLIAEI